MANFDEPEQSEEDETSEVSATEKQSEVAKRILEPREEYAQKIAHRKGKSVVLNILTVFAIIVGLVALVFLAFYFANNWLPALPLK